MITVPKIALLHLLLLASQAFYMYVSNKSQLKKGRYLFALAVPIAMGFPLILYSRSPDAYFLYEYAIVICMITAAIADATVAAARNREYLTDENTRRFHYSYFMICLMTVFFSGAGIMIGMTIALILAGLFCWSHFLKKHPAEELSKAIPLALFSVACSWALLHFA